MFNNNSRFNHHNVTLAETLGTRALLNNEAINI
jgi:hypothetical protein